MLCASGVLDTVLSTLLCVSGVLDAVLSTLLCVSGVLGAVLGALRVRGAGHRVKYSMCLGCWTPC